MQFKLSRREMLEHSGLGAGTLALAALLADDQLLAAEDRSPVRPKSTGTAKSVILLFMSGGPSQVDTFDPKPILSTLDGQDVPESLAANVPRIKRAGLINLMASPFKFRQYGKSGLPVSDLLPATARCVDDLCVIRSMHHRNPVHGPGECVALTGTQLGDRPSLGAWLHYGLGSENLNLPGFIVMNLNSTGMQYPQAPGWGTSFLPARFQGTLVDASTGIKNVAMPSFYTQHDRRAQLNLLESLNRHHQRQLGENSELEARIQSYELAYRMQTAAPELFDLDAETEETTRLYGIDHETTRRMGRHCLLARRMVERGVRFVQLRFGGWDAHGKLLENHRQQAAMTDVPIAGLLTDLRRRGLLDQTLVVWGGEFGRTPTMEGRGKGRDHNPSGYTMWLAGGGIRGGQVIGQTDEIGYVPVDRPVRPSDFHATILQALGIDQHQLYYMHNNRKELVTVLGGDVVQEAFG